MLISSCSLGPGLCAATDNISTISQQDLNTPPASNTALTRKSHEGKLWPAHTSQITQLISNITWLTAGSNSSISSAWCTGHHTAAIHSLQTACVITEMTGPSTPKASLSRNCSTHHPSPTHVPLKLLAAPTHPAHSYAHTLHPHVHALCPVM